MAISRRLWAAIVICLSAAAVFAAVAHSAPGNDDFADATDLGSGFGPFDGDTIDATEESGEPNHAGDPGGSSVWYRWTAPSDMRMMFEVCGSDFDTLLAVYTGSAVNALTPVASNDDAPEQDCGLSDVEGSRVVFDAVGGTSYMVAIDGVSGAEGFFTLQATGPPANDDFANAEPVSLPSTAPGTNYVAGKESGEPNHAGDPGGRSVWYEWTAASTGPVGIDVCDTNFDTLLSVYTGSAVNALTPVASNDDDAGCGPLASGSRLSFVAVSGQSYKIAVDGAGGVRGHFTLSLAAPPANDDFASATDLGSGLPISVGFESNRIAGKQLGEPDHAGNAGGASVWYSWTAGTTEPVKIATCSSSFDTLLGVYTGTAVGLLTPVASNDDGGCPSGSKVVINAVAGTTYKIAVDGKDGEQGDFMLELAAQRTLTLNKAGVGTGSVTSDPVGISCGVSCSSQAADFNRDQQVSLTATPASGSSFSGWTNCDFVAGNTCLMFMGADKNVTATFVPASPQHTLTVNKSGTGASAGTVSSSPSGISCGATCSAGFDVSSSVTLTASPGSNNNFSGWTNCDNPSGNTCVMSMSSDKTVSASFTLDQHQLAVTATGNGTVGSAPAGIAACSSGGGTCQANFDHGTNVTLTASPGTTLIVEWGGCDSENGNQCTVGMNAGHAVTADFRRPTLDVNKAGAGSGTVTGTGIDCGADCTEPYDAGSQVTLTATPSGGSTFAGWTDCDNPNGDQCTMTVASDKTVTANFDIAIPRTLAVGRNGSGTGTVSGPGVNCGSDCGEIYNDGTNVTLTATPATGATFAGWTGCDNPSGNVCSFVMDADKNVIATFDAIPRTLTAAKNGTGLGTVTGTGIDCGIDCSETVNHGTQVVLTAGATAGSVFSGWTGCDNPSGNQCTQTLDGDETVTATFNIAPPTPRTLTVTKGGSGAGTVTGTGIDCGSDCLEVFDDGTQVTLTATPAGGSTFASWSGCDSPSGNHCTQTMDGNETVTANFNAIPPARTLTVSRNGSGSGAVSGSGINCGSDCSESYSDGTQVTLTATPSGGSSFASWTGCDNPSGNFCTMTMSADKSVIATFDPPAPPPPPGSPPPPGPPETTLLSAKVKGTARKVVLSFTGSAGSGALQLECKLDGKAFASCASPKTFKKLKPGKHTVSVRAVDSRGTADPSPATKKFKIPKKKK